MKRRVRVLGNRIVAPLTHVLDFGVVEGGAFQFEAGQYITFYLTRGGANVTRSYSFYSEAGTVERFELLVKQVPGGFASTLLCGLSATSTPDLSGLAPLGRFLLRPPGDRAVLFVATGTGLAPFRPMLAALRATSPETPVALVFGNRYREDIIADDDHRALERAWPSFRYVPVLSRPPTDGSWTGGVGHVQATIRERFPDLAKSDVYICGLPEMVNEVQALALSLNCPKERVFVERY